MRRPRQLEQPPRGGVDHRGGRAGTRRDVHRLAECGRGRRIGEIALELARGEQRVGDDRRVARSPRGRQRGARRDQARGIAAERALGASLADLLAHTRYEPARDLGLGRRDLRHQPGRVATRRDRRQREHGIERVIDRVATAGGQQVERGPRVVEPARQALHAQIEDVGGLLAAHAGRAAGVDVAGLPRAGPPVDELGQARERRHRIRPVRARERALEVRMDDGIPYRADPIVARAALRSRVRPRDDEAERGEHDHTGDRRGGSGPAPALARRALERGQQRRHRWMPLRRIGRQAADEHAPEPRRHAAVCRGRRDGTEQHVDRQLLVARAGERARAVQRLVERDAERELIGLRRRGAAGELLGRHVRRRAHDRAGASEIL